jgi:hypothetical protein
MHLRQCDLQGPGDLSCVQIAKTNLMSKHPSLLRDGQQRGARLLRCDGYPMITKEKTISYFGGMHNFRFEPMLFHMARDSHWALH